MTRYAKQLASILSDTVRAQNTDFLSEDFAPQREGTLVRITIATQTAVAVRLLPSSGESTKLQAAALGAEVLSTFEMALDPSLTYNLQTPDAAGTTVNYLVVQEVDA